MVDLGICILCISREICNLYKVIEKWFTIGNEIECVKKRKLTQHDDTKIVDSYKSNKSHHSG